jgi:hypothetical protein
MHAMAGANTGNRKNDGLMPVNSSVALSRWTNLPNSIV